MRKIYYNGTILTLEDSLYAKGVLVENGIIQEVYYEEVPKEKDDVTYIDLKGNVLMPSFIDSHSHIAQVAMTLQTVDLSSCSDFVSLKETLTKHCHSGKSCLIGFGYDHNHLLEKSHPTKQLLDEVSSDIPILITHKSGHMGVGNSAFLKIAGLADHSKNPQGGFIGRDEEGKLNGYLEEAAFMQATSMLPTTSLEEMSSYFEKAQDMYLSYGITTAQDGLTKEKDFQLLSLLAKEKKLKLDIVSYIDMKECGSLVLEHPEYATYQNHYRIGGYKLILDGSPQGKTAWLSSPYEGEDSYCGYPVYQDKEVHSFLKKALEEEKQILVHCNGDAASEQFIRTCESFGKRDFYRPVMIHAQTVRKDQLKRMSSLGMIPSFFVAHVYYWGDTHLQNLGDRSYHISPSKTALNLHLPFTFHQDTPVLPPDMFQTIWCSVKRQTKNGIILGEEERISVLDALRAVTINAAYQYFEENQKGSIRPFKNADFIIVDQDPLKVEIDQLLNIKILETIFHGETVFQR